MKKLIVLIILLGAASAYLASNAVNAVKSAQHSRVTALSVADQNN